MARRNRFQILGVTPEDVEELYVHRNKTDVEIAALYGVSDVAVSYFRKKWGIQTRSSLERSRFGHDTPKWENITPVELATLYASMGDRQIAAIYKISKPTVAAKRRLFGVLPQSKHQRATKSCILTEEQRDVLLGTLLGDGHVLKRGVFKLTHYQEQLGYLRAVHQILAPIAKPIYYEEKELANGTLAMAFGFRTDQHDWLRSIRRVFYPDGQKVFPTSVLSQLSPRALSYWYFDDGHLDGLPSIALGSTQDISVVAAAEIAALVGARFSLDTYTTSTSDVWNLRFRARTVDTFFKHVREFTPVDLLYKLPPKHRPQGLSLQLPVRTKDPVLLPGSLVKAAQKWAAQDTETQDRVVSKATEFWREKGFPYHTPRPEELTVLLNLEQPQVIQGGHIKARQVGQATCQGVCRNIWSGRSFGGESPEDLFQNDAQLRALVEFCLQAGDIPNAARLRSALRFKRRTGVYNFRPSAAKVLVDRFCPPGGTVLDPCGGYGGRLLGAVLSKARPTYVAYEPSTQSFEGLQKLYNWVCSYLPEVLSKVTLHHEPAEEATFPRGVDVVLTSPPYWKREVYSDEETQSGIRYTTYDEWLGKFWGTVLTNSLEALKPGGWLVVNVDDFSLGGRSYPLIADTIKLVTDLGLDRPERYAYDLPGGSSPEVVLCWARKGVVSEVQQATSGQALVLPRCRSCGKVSPVPSLHDGVCLSCLTPSGHTVVCEGCGKSFLTNRSEHRFHDRACYARFRRRKMRETCPAKTTRTFTCKSCGSRWETSEPGNFSTCPECKTEKEVARRTKACRYRYCGEAFVDTSPQNSMSYCCVEHRRREKLLRSGVAKDENYFRLQDA